MKERLKLFAARIIKVFGASPALNHAHERSAESYADCIQEAQELNETEVWSRTVIASELQKETSLLDY